MATVRERVGLSAPQVWLGGVAVAVVALVAGSVLFPELVYDGFVWHYFWGPVQADANSAVCAVRQGGEVAYLYSTGECSAAAEPVAYPGYTIVSEVGYVFTLIVALSGLVFMLQALDIGQTTAFFYALVPFFLFGGALRVVEDADNAVEATLFPYPWDTLVISPIIYFTVFFVTLASVAVGVVYARSVGGDGADRTAGADSVDSADGADSADSANYVRPVAVLGGLAVTATLAYLGWLAATGTEPVTFYPQVLAATLTVSVVATLVTWEATKRVIPVVHAGTGRAGLVVLFAHALDGAANVIGLDYMVALGAGPNLVPKHPVNQFVVDTAGAAWPFLLVKLVAAVGVLYIFDDTLFAESPRYGVLLLIAVTAVGMGPGSRDALRATLGI